MEFSNKLKALRRRAGYSQEKLAEKLSVSRQAVTKWESGAGTPDIENLIAIAALFGVTVDELISVNSTPKTAKEFLYESVSEYDIDRPKKFDIHVGGAESVILSGTDGEKLRITLASDTLATIQSDLKLKIDDNKNALDVDLNKFNGLTELVKKQSLNIIIELPDKFASKIELAAETVRLDISNLSCDGIEFDGKTQNVTLNGVEGIIELNCNNDMDIKCLTLNGRIEVNQLSATSRICVPEGANFRTVKKGIANSVFYEINGKACVAFDDAASENAIELNGIKSELIICK